MLLCVVLRQLETVFLPNLHHQPSSTVGVNSSLGIGVGVRIGAEMKMGSGSGLGRGLRSESGLGTGIQMGIEMTAMFSSLMTPWIVRCHCLNRKERFYLPYPIPLHGSSTVSVVDGVDEGIVMPSTLLSTPTPINDSSSHLGLSPSSSAISSLSPCPLDQLALLSSCVSYVSMDDPRCQRIPSDTIRAYVQYLLRCLR